MQKLGTVVLSFAGVFLLAVSLLGIATYFELFNGWTEALASQMGMVLGLLGYTAKVSGSTVLLPSRTLLVIPECTAVYVMAVYASLVLAYPFSTRRKMGALAIGLPIIYIANFGRLLAVAVLAFYVKGNMYNFLHDYLFQLGMVLVTFGVWVGVLEYDRRKKTSQSPLPATKLERMKMRNTIVLPYISFVQVLWICIAATCVGLVFWVLSSLLWFPSIALTFVVAPIIGWMLVVGQMTLLTRLTWSASAAFAHLCACFVLMALGLPSTILEANSMVVYAALGSLYLVLLLGVPALAFLAFTFVKVGEQTEQA